MSWEKFMLPCLSKQLFGLDCPGCGMQRSAILLFEGHFEAAFHMFPAIFTLLTLFLLVGIKLLFNKNLSKIIIPLAIFNGLLIISSFLYKILYLTQ